MRQAGPSPGDLRIKNPALYMPLDDGLPAGSFPSVTFPTPALD